MSELEHTLERIARGRQLPELGERRRDRQLPVLAGGAPAWVLPLPGALFGFGGEVTRGPNVEASQETPNLVGSPSSAGTGTGTGVDSPSLMTEWVLTSINLSAEFTSRSNEAVHPASVMTAIAQLLVGGDVVWQQGQEVQPVVALKFATARFRLAGDFNNPIPLPRGRTLTLRFTLASSVETTQITGGMFGNNGNNVPGATALPSRSTITYYARPLTGHRTL